MKRGREKIWASYPFGFGVARSSDGKWERNGMPLPRFWMNLRWSGASFVIGEYAINVVWCA